MSDALTGKVAIVTGASRGIGAAIARGLAKAGARVVVCGRNQADLDAVAKEIGGVALRLDLTHRAQTDEVIASVGHVDVLVNNAGVAESAALDRTTDAIWDRIMELDATAPFRVIRALVPSMIAAKWGRVINVASNAGISGYGYSAAYCAAKHAMVGMTRALAIDLARTGIRVNVVAPGVIETEAFDAMPAERAAGLRATYAQKTALARLGTVNELAGPVLFLLSDHAAYITGETLNVDGGI